MHDPEFEKHVQRKMEELQFSPSAEVWKKVEDEMKKEKKRRLPMLWIFLLSGLLLGAGYWVFLNRDKNISKATKIAEQENLNVKNEKAASGTENISKKDITEKAAAVPPKKNSDHTAINRSTEAPKEDLKKRKTITNSITDRAGKVAIDANAEIKSGLVQGRSLHQRTKNGKPKSSNADGSLYLNSVSSKDKDIKEKNANDIVNNNDHDKSIEKNNDEEIGKPQSRSQQTINATDSFNKKNDQEVKSEKKTTDSVVAMKSAFNDPVSQNSKSIKVGFTAGFGSSGINNTLGSTYYANVPASATGNPVTIHTPSSMRSGLSYYAGVFFKRSLSSTVSVSAGLNYHYYSTSITTGKPGDTVAYVYSSNNYTIGSITPVSVAQGSYYTSGSSRTYVNHYHFIELPLLLKLQLNSSKKLLINWQAGFSISYLLSADALQYDKISGVYYNNNSLFNKMQLNAITGFSVGFYQKKNLFLIGPEVQYGATNVLNNQANTKQHIFYAGLKFSFIPQKK